MSFNPGPSNQAQEIIFFHKLQKLSHSSIYFNKNPVKQVSSQKHLGIILDLKIFKSALKIQ